MITLDDTKYKKNFLNYAPLEMRKKIFKNDKKQKESLKQQKQLTCLNFYKNKNYALKINSKKVNIYRK